MCHAFPQTASELMRLVDPHLLGVRRIEYSSHVFRVKVNTKDRSQCMHTTIDLNKLLILHH